MRLLFILLVLSLLGCGSIPTKHLDTQEVSTKQFGKILNLHTQQELTPDELIQVLSKEKRVLLGEQHDQVKHHQAQLWLLEHLNAQRQQGSLLMEMLRVDQQPLVNKTALQLKAQPKFKESRLPKALNWNESWPWSFYGELVTHALFTPYDLVSTNLTRQEVATLMKGGQPLNGDVSTSKLVRNSIGELIVASHGCDCTTEDVFIQHMVDVQQFRDRRMAEKLLMAKTPSVLVAGNYHVNKRVGVPLHLMDLNQRAPYVVLVMVDDAGSLTPKEADYVWVIKK